MTIEKINSLNLENTITNEELFKEEVDAKTTEENKEMNSKLIKEMISINDYM